MAGDDDGRYRLPVLPVPDTTPLTDVPCGVCPVVSECRDGGVISPQVSGRKLRLPLRCNTCVATQPERTARDAVAYALTPAFCWVTFFLGRPASTTTSGWSSEPKGLKALGVAVARVRDLWEEAQPVVAQHCAALQECASGGCQLLVHAASRVERVRECAREPQRCLYGFLQAASGSVNLTERHQRLVPCARTREVHWKGGRNRSPEHFAGPPPGPFGALRLRRHLQAIGLRPRSSWDAGLATQTRSAGHKRRDQSPVWRPTTQLAPWACNRGLRECAVQAMWCVGQGAMCAAVYEALLWAATNGRAPSATQTPSSRPATSAFATDPVRHHVRRAGPAANGPVHASPMLLIRSCARAAAALPASIAA